MDFSDIQRQFDLEFARKWRGGGGGIWYVFLTFLDDWLYYGYNTASNNSA